MIIQPSKDSEMTFIIKGVPLFLNLSFSDFIKRKEKKSAFSYQEGKIERGINWKIKIDIYTLLYIK